jgi:hypothetical protein
MAEFFNKLLASDFMPHTAPTRERGTGTGNRVLQQVILSLVMNGLDAMSAVSDRPR